MDYFPLPRIQEHTTQLRLLCGCAAYDSDIPFEAFPSQRGWDVSKLLNGELEGKPASKAAAFLQQWLYFGVIATVFAVADTPFNLDEFVELQTDSTITGYFTRFLGWGWRKGFSVTHSLSAPDVNTESSSLLVTGRPLVAGLKSLEAKAQSASDEEKRLGFSKINTAVDLAIRVVSLFTKEISTSTSDDDDHRGDQLRSILPGEIELSVLLLAETLKYTLVEVYGFRLNLQPQASLWLFNKMGSLGWCQALLMDLLHQYGLRFILYSYLRGSIPGQDLDHSRCQGKRCIASNIEEDKYVTRHTNPDLVFRPKWWEFHLVIVRRTNNVWYAIKGTSMCDCHHLSPNISKIQTILLNGGIPLISMRTPRFFDSEASLISIELDIIEWDPTIPYTAISHIWSDGVGNPHSNSLPLCQLLELRNILRAARADIHEAKSWIPGGIRNIITTLTASPERIYFWMDTLCVPLDKDTRRLAIAKLSDCYKNAALVLARDSFMMRCSCSAPDDDILYRLNLSSWIRRMWTFQEAALARRVYVQLSDGFERLIHLPKYFDHVKQSRDVVVTRDVRKNILMFSLTIAGLQLELLSPPKRLLSVALALAMRTTSKRADEAICLATLLKRGLDEVLKVQGKERWHALMPALIELLSPSVIFMRGPKMSIPGYRWAPSTFLDLESENELGLLALRENSDDSPLQLTDRGVLVDFPGLLFKAILKPLLPIFCFESIDATKRYWATTGIRPGSNSAYDFENAPSGDGYGLVMRHVPGEKSQNNAVLLADCFMKDEIIYGSYVCILLVEKLLQQADRPPYVNERVVWDMITAIPDFKKNCWFPDVEREFLMQRWCIS